MEPESPPQVSPDSNSDNLHIPPEQPDGRKSFLKPLAIVIFAVSVLILIITVGVIVFLSSKQSQTTTGPQSKTDTIQVLSQTIPQTDCKQYAGVIKLDPRKESCYAKVFQTNVGDATFVANGYSPQQLAQQERNCSLDCGGSIYSQALEGFLITKDNTIYDAPIVEDLAGASILVQSNYSGCVSNKDKNFKNTGGSFELRSDKVLAIIKVADEDIVDNFGNHCLVSYNAWYEEGKNIQLSDFKVQYINIVGASACTSQPSEYDKLDCLKSLALIHNDISYCKDAILSDDTRGGTGNSGCVQAAAVRRGDASLCGTIVKSDNAWIEHCYAEVKRTKGGLIGNITII